jgi:hypothetical protein
MAFNSKKRKLEVDLAISSCEIDQREQMLVHEIRLSNVLNMVSCHDDLKDEIMRAVSTDSDFISSRFTLRILKNRELKFVSGFLSFYNLNLNQLFLEKYGESIVYQSHVVEFAVYTHCSVSREVRSIGTSPALMNVRGFPVVEETDRVCESISKLNKSLSTLSFEYSVSSDQVIKSSTSASSNKT